MHIFSSFFARHNVAITTDDTEARVHIAYKDLNRRSSHTCIPCNTNDTLQSVCRIKVKHFSLVYVP